MSHQITGKPILYSADVGGILPKREEVDKFLGRHRLDDELDPAIIFGVDYAARLAVGRAIVLDQLAELILIPLFLSERSSSTSPVA